jgi:hypothetical protein
MSIVSVLISSPRDEAHHQIRPPSAAADTHAANIPIVNS